LLKSGASPDKLVLGVQFEGRAFILEDINLHEVGSASNGTGMQGPYTEIYGFLQYNEVCTGLNINSSILKTFTN
jgi:chitinase